MIEKFTSWLNEFDIAKILPDLNSMLDLAENLLRFCLFVGPLLMLAIGLCRFFIPYKEASHRIGFQSFFAKGSPAAWSFSQKIVGAVWSVLGVILLFMMVAVNAQCSSKDIIDVCGIVIKQLFLQGILVLAVYVILQFAIAVLFNYKGVARFKK